MGRSTQNCPYHFVWNYHSYIERRSQKSYNALCGGIVSHGAQIGGIQVFADHTSRNKRKQNVSTIFTHCAVFPTCLSSSSDRSSYAPDELGLFWSKTLYPKLEPLCRKMMVQVLGSPVYICVNYAAFRATNLPPSIDCSF